MSDAAPAAGAAAAPPPARPDGQVSGWAEVYRALVEGAGQHAIFLVGTDGRIASWSPSAEAIFGAAEADAVGSPLALFAPAGSDAAGWAEDALAAAAESGTVSGSGWRVRPDGSRFYSRYALSALRAPDGSLRGFVKVTQDATAQHVAELRLAERSHELAAAQRLARLGTFRYALTTGAVRLSDELYRVLGLLPGEFGGTIAAFLERFHREDRDRVGRVIAGAVQSGQPFGFEARVVHADGRVRRLHVTGTVGADPAGVVNVVEGVGQDVTELREAVEARAEMAARLQVILDTVGDAVLGVDRAGRCSFANPAAIHLLGTTPPEIVGRPVHTVLGCVGAEPGDCERCTRTATCPLAVALRDRQPLDGQMVLRAADGPVPVAFACRPVADGTGPLAAVLTLRDDSTRLTAERSERRLARAEDRRHSAIELNDHVVQGLSLALYALGTDDEDAAGRPDLAQARALLADTLDAAKQLVAGLLSGDQDGEPAGIVPGTLVRRVAAQPGSDWAGTP